jgi:hypothetical protein
MGLRWLASDLLADACRGVLAQGLAWLAGWLA